MWNKVIPESFKNIKLIFPTQQRDIYTLISQASADKNVRKIIIFGSSVTNACNPWSDIDVYFELVCDKKLPSFFDIYAPLDKWTNFTVDKFLKEEILEKGVVVYG